MARIAAVIVLAALIAPAAIFSSQESPAIIEDAATANEYVHVARMVMPPGGTISVPETGHVHLLIAIHAGALTDVTDSLHPQRLELSEGSGVRMFAAGRAYAFSNNEQKAFSGLWLELQKDLGHITCSEGKACPWSVRAMDPFPLLLSEHATVFVIRTPWKPEPRSLIVPEGNVEIAGKIHAAGEPIWMETAEEISEAGKNEAEQPNVTHLVPSGRAESFVEVAFYDRSFCFCKRVRQN